MLGVETSSIVDVLTLKDEWQGDDLCLRVYHSVCFSIVSVGVSLFKGYVNYVWL